MKPLLPNSEPLTDDEIKVNWRARSRFKIGPYPPALEFLLKIGVIVVIYLLILLVSIGIIHLLKANLPSEAPVQVDARKV